MPEVTIKCPYCQKELEATEDMAGQTADCPNCGKASVIPAQPKPKLQLRKSAPSLPRSSPPPAPPFYSAPNPAPLREPPRKQMAFTCPHCGTDVQGSCYAGETVECLTCNGLVIVPQGTAFGSGGKRVVGLICLAIVSVLYWWYFAGGGGCSATTGTASSARQFMQAWQQGGSSAAPLLDRRCPISNVTSFQIIDFRDQSDIGENTYMMKETGEMVAVEEYAFLASLKCSDQVAGSRIIISVAKDTGKVLKFAFE